MYTMAEANLNVYLARIKMTFPTWLLLFFSNKTVLC